VFSKAEELKSMGLSVPQITRVFIELNKMGFDLRTDVYTMDFAVKKLLEKL
jgi:energy-coupling factor transport system ATP-binding protein